MNDQPLGRTVDPTPRPFPQRLVHRSRSVTLEPLTVAQADQLWAAAEGAEASWACLRYSPFAGRAAMAGQVAALAARCERPLRRRAACELG